MSYKTPTYTKIGEQDLRMEFYAPALAFAAILVTYLVASATTPCAAAPTEQGLQPNPPPTTQPAPPSTQPSDTQPSESVEPTG